jgi:hypothetical protein
MIVRLVVAAVTLLLAADGGTYGLTSRHSLAIAVWWTILIGVALGLFPRARLTTASTVVGALLALFALWTAASVMWAPSAERAFLEFDRAALFVGIFALVGLASTREDVAAWCDGLAIGLAGVAAVALGSRFFPDIAPTSEVVRFLPEARGRLTYPVEYWNGLGILLGLAVPLLLRPALAARSALTRGLALAPLPAVAAAIYLTSSRGGAVVALVGAAGFAALSGRPWSAAASAFVGAAGVAGAVSVLEARPDLANAVGDAPAEQGPTAAVLIGAICLATGAAHGLGCRLLRAPRAPRAASRVAVAAVVGLVIAAVIAAEPAERFETFKRTPAETALPREGFVTAHLLSGGGSGRWQFWTAAADQFREHPWRGGGAGSYEPWWAQHGSFSYFIRDAHSLYLETLAELGVVGFTLLVAALVVGLVAGIASLRGAPEAHRSTLAVLTATFVAYALGAGIDWMWELTVVSVVGIACLGLLAAAASARDGPRPGRGYPIAVGAAALAAAWVIICLEALPLLTQLQIERSQAAVRRGDAADAISAADTARRLEPWAASPYTQLALVHEQTGQLDDARRWIDEALERNPSDWRNWLIAARVQTKAGDVDSGRRSLARAIELNPRSPLFRNRP